MSITRNILSKAAAGVSGNLTTRDCRLMDPTIMDALTIEQLDYLGGTGRALDTLLCTREVARRAIILNADGKRELFFDCQKALGHLGIGCYWPDGIRGVKMALDMAVGLIKDSTMFSDDINEALRAYFCCCNPGDYRPTIRDRRIANIFDRLMDLAGDSRRAYCPAA